ncbi:hypothetical protein VR010_09305 [Actinomycetaceae bacterium L2_0104]
MVVALSDDGVVEIPGGVAVTRVEDLALPVVVVSAAVTRGRPGLIG